MSLKVCVFCSSSSNLDFVFHKQAEDLATGLAKLGVTIINGAGEVGLMGTLTNTARKNGGKVIGIIPEKLNLPHIVSKNCSELIVTKTLAERKDKMFQMADIFVVLPGGFGTLEEMFEALTMSQLGYFNKVVYLLNSESFFDPLIEMLNKMVDSGIISKEHRNLLQVFNSVEGLKSEIEQNIIQD
jgi:uncharacterized protein (TIGR00730 family)